MLRKLGKLLFFILLALPLSASVKTVSAEYFMEGEALQFQIIAKGFDITVPEISLIEGYPVEMLRTSQEAVLINSRKANKLTKTYQLFPKKDFTIPPFKLLIDGGVKTTQAHDVVLKKISKTLSEDFDLQMSLEKKAVYLGEELTLKVTFTYKDVEDYTILPPEFSEISVQELNSKEWKKEDGRWVEELTYSLKPHKEGNLILAPLKARLEVLKEGYKNLNNKSRYTQKISVYSNALNLEVKPLAEDLSLVGEYSLTASVNKQKVNMGEAVILTLMIEGEGNLDNLDALTLQIPDATIYTKESKKDDEKRLHTKTFELICEHNFTIPAFTLPYFHTKTRTPKILRTHAFDINVINGLRLPQEKGSDDKEIQNKTEKETISMSEKLLFFLIGSLSTLVLIAAYTIWKKRTQTVRHPSWFKAIQESTSQDSLFKKMVPHLGKDKTLDRLIYRLEGENVSDFKKLKKEIILRAKKLSK